MKRLAAAFVVTAGLLQSQNAAALSCVPPNIAEDFNHHHSSTSVFRLALGRFEPLTGAEKLTGSDKGFSYKVRFTGKPLSKRGFGKRFTQTLTVRETCILEWCGKTPTSDQDALVFLPQGDEPTLEFGACDFGHFQTDKAVLNILRACIRNGTCTDDMIRKAGNL